MKIIENKQESKYWLLGELKVGELFAFCSTPKQLYMVLEIGDSNFLELYDDKHIAAALIGYIDDDNESIKTGLVQVFASNCEVIKYTHINDFEVVRCG